MFNLPQLDEGVAIALAKDINRLYSNGGSIRVRDVFANLGHDSQYFDATGSNIDADQLKVIRTALEDVAKQGPHDFSLGLPHFAREAEEGFTK